MKIGDDCSVGNMAFVLYDTQMEKGSELGPLSLLMKGETLPAGMAWHGNPCQPICVTVKAGAIDTPAIPKSVQTSKSLHSRGDKDVPGVQAGALQ